MTIQLLKQYLELGHLSMYKQWTYTKKTVFFLKKTMKAYFRAINLSIEIYENILNFNFLMGDGEGRGGRGVRHTYGLRKFFKAVIIAIKNNEALLNLWPRENTFELTLISVNELDAKRWKRGKIHGTIVVCGLRGCVDLWFHRWCGSNSWLGRVGCVDL